jgi:autotransporter passenger strand-loop-strand repeat protein
VYGSAGATTIDSGGNAYVFGTASGTIVSSGGTEYILSGGIDSGTTLNGGFEIVSPGGTVSGIISFGDSGGRLVLDQTASSTINVGRINGFTTSSDQLDLADISFNSLQPLGLTPGSNNTTILTVSDGTNMANITLLGQYMAGNFTSASDGHGGTLLTDPPQTAMEQPLVTQPVHTRSE